MITQRSPEWFTQRMGKITGSNTAKLTDKLKSGKYSASRKSEIMAITTERLTGQAREPIFINRAMEHGNTYEPVAFRALTKRYKFRVFEASFKDHPTIESFGSSPDGYIGHYGVIEIKCPSTETFVRYVMEDKVPDEYKSQMMSEILCHGRKYALFVAFDPRIKDPKKRLFLKIYKPTVQEIESFKEDIISANQEIKQNLELFEQINIYEVNDIDLED